MTWQTRRLARSSPPMVHNSTRPSVGWVRLFLDSPREQKWDSLESQLLSLLWELLR